VQLTLAVIHVEGRIVTRNNHERGGFDNAVVERQLDHFRVMTRTGSHPSGSASIWRVR
jgi:hypothetical protein